MGGLSGGGKGRLVNMKADVRHQPRHTGRKEGRREGRDTVMITAQWHSHIVIRLARHRDKKELNRNVFSIKANFKDLKVDSD